MYSSGMFARLAFAVNAYVEPDILIVDEALSVGDVAFQAKCISRMRQMIKNGVTVLFVTHAMNVVKNFCKKCIYLQNGKIEAYGEAEEVADLYLHQVRENMNKINTTIECSNQVNTLQELNHDDNKSFKYDKGLDGRVKQFRQGNGKARITAVDICNLDDAAILTAEYNQKIKIKLYIEGYDTVDIVVGYLIRDNMNLEILGGGNYYDMDNPNIHVEVGKKFIIEFITRVPLLQGTYNFVFVLSTPVDDETAIFVDHIENACFLEVGRREKRQLWSKVHLEEECNIIAIK
jgi:ABC-type glutathione transport system ATPase component